MNMMMVSWDGGVPISGAMQGLCHDRSANMPETGGKRPPWPAAGVHTTGEIYARREWPAGATVKFSLPSRATARPADVSTIWTKARQDLRGLQRSEFQTIRHCQLLPPSRHTILWHRYHQLISRHKTSHWPHRPMAQQFAAFVQLPMLTSAAPILKNTPPGANTYSIFRINRHVASPMAPTTPNAPHAPAGSAARTGRTNKRGADEVGTDGTEGGTDGTVKRQTDSTHKPMDTTETVNDLTGADATMEEGSEQTPAPVVTPNAATNRLNNLRNKGRQVQASINEAGDNDQEMSTNKDAAHEQEKDES